MGMGQFAWVEFYEELASTLLEYANNRQALLRHLSNAYAQAGIPLPTIDRTSTPEDIDPFTVFGLFTRGITNAKRIAIIDALAQEFGIVATRPITFNGAPGINNLAATFNAFDSETRTQDIENLWRVFKAGIALADNDSPDNRAQFSITFDATLGQRRLGYKLTTGLYWIRPRFFINLDSRNRWFLHSQVACGTEVANLVPPENEKELITGATYLKIRDLVASTCESTKYPFTSFPEIAHAAFTDAKKVNAERKEQKTLHDSDSSENSLGDADVETTHYWLYAPGKGASMWENFYSQGVMGLAWEEAGDLSAYASKEAIRLALVDSSSGTTNPRNDAYALWQFANDLKPGDVVFVKGGRGKILGRGLVTGDYEYDEAQGHFRNLRSVEWTHKGEWAVDRVLPMKTLTDITDDTTLVAAIETLFEVEADEVIDDQPAIEYPAYDREDFLSEVFMSEQQYDTLTGLLRTKKNVILQGAPGVGKTFAAKRLAYSIMGTKDAKRVMMVQFHQSYSYEDFIEGYRPCADGFELSKGAFYTFCKQAAEDNERDYFFIIDEINRGNLSKIFGELFMLIENDKRGEKNKLQLLYSRERFCVPSNVFLIGLMNTADRSLALLDYALRRRFAFFTLNPGFSSTGFTRYREAAGSTAFDGLVSCVARLNTEIASDESLGEGFMIGHSYFCGFVGGTVDHASLSAIIEYELIPMLGEYWFDDLEKVRLWSEALRRSIQ